MKLRFILLLFSILLLSNQIVLSQVQGQQRIDSLLNEITNLRDDSTGVILLAQLSFSYQGINPQKGVDYGNMAFNLASKIKWDKGISEAYNAIGTNYMSLSENQKALDYFEKSIKINMRIQYKSGIATNYNNIAIMYSREYDYDKSLEYYEKALKINRELGKKNAIASNLFNIGNIYRNKLNYNKAIENYFQSLKVNEEIGRKVGVANNLENIGLIYSRQNIFDKAIEYYLKARDINAELGRKVNLANNINNIGVIYTHQNDYLRAIEYFNESLEINLQIGNQRSIANNYSNLGDVQQKIGNYAKSLEFFHKALEINEKIDNPNGRAINYGNIGTTYLNQILFPSGDTNNRTMVLDEALQDTILNKSYFYLNKAISVLTELDDIHKLSYYHEKLALVCELLGDYQAAYESFRKHKTMQDSIFSSENKKVSESIAERDNQLKDEKIKSLEAIDHINDLYKSILFGSVFFLIILLTTIYVRFREKKKLSEKLTFQNQEIEIQRANLEEMNEHVFSSIRYASSIQNALLPWENTLANSFKEHFTIYKPKAIVSGDCYWYQSVNGIKFVAAVDCTGHGVPGSMLAVIANTALDDAVVSKRLTDTSEILHNINMKVTEVLHQRDLENTSRDGMEIALVAIHKEKLQFSGAGRPLYIFDKELEIIKTDRKGIAGYLNNLDYEYKSHVCPIHDGMKIYLTTDGYADQMNEEGKKFGTKRFLELLKKISMKPLKEQHEILLSELAFHQGSRNQIDDITIVGIEL
ncbi:MAG: tetratricopeptide repeat protein [Candidatus Kapabacteria bacterium]|nr:tetratricopeptide repeat protein [Candidatus Kapabacteria bacterium]